MGKAKDLTGMKFGKWTVLERGQDKMYFNKKRNKYVPTVMWLCQCECGTIKLVEGRQLRRKNVTGCVNCFRPANYTDLKGKRFGRLVVVSEAGRTKTEEVLWNCICDCGEISVVSTSNLKRGNTLSCGCLAMEIKKERAEQSHLEAVKRKEELKSQKDAERKSQREAREEQKKIDRLNSKKHICSVCGKEFTRRTTQQVMCKECHDKKTKEKERIRRSTNKRLREARAKYNGKIDYSITLSKLIERDKGICQLCGRPVDETDYIYINDTFIAGNDYPSIDHIIPLSKGGSHQWDNVQLAHRICNSIKCDK